MTFRRLVPFAGTSGPACDWGQVAGKPRQVRNRDSSEVAALTAKQWSATDG